MKMLDKLLRRVPADLLDAESAFSRDDRKAIVREFAEADAIEPGLGAAIARYVIEGEGESVMLRITALLAKGGEAAEMLKLCLLVPRYAPRGLKLSPEDIDKRLTLRRRILIDLDGFDAAGMRRLGLVQAKAASWLYNYGTDRSPFWLRALSQASDTVRAYRSGHEERPPFLNALFVRDMLAVEGLSVAPLVDLMFGGPRYGQKKPEERMAGLVSVLEADPAAVCEAMLQLPPANRGVFINYLADVGLLDRVPAYFERIFLAAGANAKATREPALGALSKMDSQRVEDRARAALGSPDVEERLAGVQALAAALGGAALALLDGHLAKEKAKKVVQAIEALRPKLALAGATTAATQDDGAEGYTAIDGNRLTPPPLRETADEIPADTEAVLRRLMIETNASSRIEWDQNVIGNEAYLKRRGAYKTPCDPGSILLLLAIMKGEARHVDRSVLGRTISPNLSFTPTARAAFDKGFKALLARPDFGVKPLARVLIAGGATWASDVPNVMRGSAIYGPAFAIELSRRTRSGADFREVLALLDQAGLPAAKGLPEALNRIRGFNHENADPPNPTVWPVLATHFDILDQAIASSSTLRRADGHAIVLGLCSLFPKPPRRFLNMLLDAAAEGARVERRRARAFLAEAGELTAVIGPLLKEASATKRAGAAQWLGERRDAAAVPVLRAALKAEKNLAAEAAILAGLAACGDDISDQFAEEKLVAEAERELPKLKVDYAAFMDRAALPALCWADGRPVDPKLVEYWFARAHKLKQPGADPLLEMVLGRLDRAGAAAMGRSILSTFVQLDTRKPTSDEANAYAEAGADARVKAVGFYRKGYTREQAFADMRQERVSTYLGSALDHRGLLALARYTSPGEAVAIVQRYLKDHGKRPNQCRALLEMLAADPIPQKLQLILATAKRHKQPGARKFAGTLADAIAEERGWSATELADRTVPTLDLDAAGVLPLPIGERSFRLRLAEDLTLVLENPDGKAISALPTPKAPDEAVAAKVAKASVAAARKELKQTVELQTARLYEAMCVSRCWDVADFAVSFLGHPIMARLLRRLVISGHDASGALVGSARLLDDGTLSDVEDGTVALDRWAQVGIAHRATLGEAAASAWLAHCADYDVTPLFSQFDRQLLTLADDTASEIVDRQGHAIDAFALRNAAAKRGYQPGGLMDGSYSTYERILPDLGLAASVGFSGGFVGDRTSHLTALHGLRFVRVRGGRPSEWDAQGIELDKVPPILLQEAWADYHAIASAGSGFDPNWGKLG